MYCESKIANFFLFFGENILKIQTLIPGVPVLRATSAVPNADPAVQPVGSDPPVPVRPHQQQQLPLGHDRDHLLRRRGHHQPPQPVKPCLY